MARLLTKVQRRILQEVVDGNLIIVSDSHRDIRAINRVDSDYLRMTYAGRAADGLYAQYALTITEEGRKALREP